MKRNKISSILVSLLVIASVSGTAFAVGSNQPAALLEENMSAADAIIQLSDEDASQNDGQAGETTVLPDLETPISETPVTTESAVDVPEATVPEVPAEEMPAVTEPAIEAPEVIVPEVPVVTEAAVETPEMTALTIKHILYLEDFQIEDEEIVTDLPLGSEYDLSSRIVQEEGIICLTDTKKVMIDAENKTITIEYRSISRQELLKQNLDE